MAGADEYDIGVIGAGAWGTTLAHRLSETGHKTLLWAFEAEVAAEINHSRTNSVYLPDVKLSTSLTATNDLAEFGTLGRLLIVVPSKFLPGTVDRLSGIVSSDARLVSASKGFVNQELSRPSEYLAEKFPGRMIGVLSGPNLSREVVRCKPAISLVASSDVGLVKEFQELLSTEYFRVYGGTDVIGTELGGALKNIMAMAAGLSDGLELGENTLAALITRGLAEMIRLGTKLGADARTFYGVSGLGDLVCTSQSRLSRNHEVGRRLALGQRLGEILGSSHAVPEGVETTKHVHRYAEKHGIDLPLTRGVYTVLFENADPPEILRELMTRTLRME